MYEQTHPVLFSDRALYVVVYSLETEINTADLQHLVKNVTVRCSKAPILLVGTHRDIMGGDWTLPLLALKKQFPQVCETAVYSSDFNRAAACLIVL